MRGIKFRAFVLGEMYEVKKLIWEERLYIITSGGFIDQGDRNTFLMQFIGLKDNNGKEIYEDDIVKNRDCVGIVTYIKDSFMVRNGDVYYPVYDNCEVLGNKYQNPELLKEIK